MPVGRARRFSSGTMVARSHCIRQISPDIFGEKNQNNPAVKTLMIFAENFAGNADWNQVPKKSS
jgi:hypothetical protein